MIGQFRNFTNQRADQMKVTVLGAKPNDDKTVPWAEKVVRQVIIEGADLVP